MIHLDMLTARSKNYKQLILRCKDTKTKFVLVIFLIKVIDCLTCTGHQRWMKSYKG